VLISDDGPVTIVRFNEQIERRADMQVQSLASSQSLLLTLAREVGEFREHEDGEGEVVKAGS
jgi:hypothetical protein